MFTDSFFKKIKKNNKNNEKNVFLIKFRRGAARIAAFFEKEKAKKIVREGGRSGGNGCHFSKNMV